MLHVGSRPNLESTSSSSLPPRGRARLSAGTAGGDRGTSFPSASRCDVVRRLGADRGAGVPPPAPSNRGLGLDMDRRCARWSDRRADVLSRRCREGVGHEPGVRGSRRRPRPHWTPSRGRRGPGRDRCDVGHQRRRQGTGRPPPARPLGGGSRIDRVVPERPYAVRDGVVRSPRWGAPGHALAPAGPHRRAPPLCLAGGRSPLSAMRPSQHPPE